MEQKLLHQGYSLFLFLHDIKTWLIRPPVAPQRQVLTRVDRPLLMLYVWIARSSTSEMTNSTNGDRQGHEDRERPALKCKTWATRFESEPGCSIEKTTKARAVLVTDVTDSTDRCFVYRQPWGF